MKVLVVGSGGREHALVWKLAQSRRVKQIYCAPGNAGTAASATHVEIPANDIKALVRFAVAEKMDLVIVGPEEPLCLGLADELSAAKIRVFGPAKAAARLEGDKAYAKHLMQHASVPTADARVFDKFRDARTYVATREAGIVVKAAGLAAGKGVIVCDDPADAILALERIMVQREFGPAGDVVVIEERLVGTEVSVMAFVDHHTIYLLENTQDHKAIGEGDRGLNTGGMGAFSPTPVPDDKTLRQVEAEALVPIIDALHCEGTPYRGLLYAGLMLTPGGPKVLEFNCRFGDPETQPLMKRLKTDLVEVIEAVLDDKLDQITLEWEPQPAVCVVMTSKGYPGQYEAGKEIRGLEAAEEVEGVTVFHAGTRSANSRVVSAGGRVLGVTALGADLAAAQQRAYQAVSRIQFDGAYYRRDIAAKALGSPATP